MVRPWLSTPLRLVPLATYHPEGGHWVRETMRFPSALLPLLTPTLFRFTVITSKSATTLRFAQQLPTPFGPLSLFEGEAKSAGVFRCQVGWLKKTMSHQSLESIMSASSVQVVVGPQEVISSCVLWSTA